MPSLPSVVFADEPAGELPEGRDCDGNGRFDSSDASGAVFSSDSVSFVVVSFVAEEVVAAGSVSFVVVSVLSIVRQSPSMTSSANKDIYFQA